MEEKLTDQELARRAKLPRYEEMGIDPFGSRYDWKDRICDLRQKYGDLSPEELEQKNISVDIAGRIVSIRKMGKASFFNLKDEPERIQVWIGRDTEGQQNYAL